MLFLSAYKQVVRNSKITRKTDVEYRQVSAYRNKSLLLYLYTYSTYPAEHLKLKLWIFLTSQKASSKTFI